MLGIIRSVATLLLALGCAAALYFENNNFAYILLGALALITLVREIMLIIGEASRQRKEKEQLAKKKEDMDIQRRKFISFVSHSLRMPISIIVGYGDLLQTGVIKDEIDKQRYVSKICENTKNLNIIVNQIISEMNNNNAEATMNIEKVDVIAVAKELIDDMQSVANQNSVGILLSTSEASAIIEADRIQLRKVFYNVIENAIKYMRREGYIHITISKTSTEEVMIVFKDDGIGLDASETENIFSLGIQGSNKKSGSGLGLYMVKSIVEAHGGNIQAKSDYGKGMCILIQLPTKQKTAPVQPLTNL